MSEILNAKRINRERDRTKEMPMGCSRFVSWTDAITYGYTES